MPSGSVNTKRKKKNDSSQKSAVLDEPTNLEKKQQRKQIFKFVETTFEKTPQQLKAEFLTMKRFNDFEKMKAFKEAQEQGRNRYKDVGCLDNNRVKLKSPWPHDYIHGNYVATPTNPKRFICTQGPLDKTCADFWFMCLQDKVEYIFMLCNLMEKQIKKCAEYFPCKKKETLEFEEGDKKITVKYQSSRQYKFKAEASAKVIATEVLVEGPNGESQKTTHYHWVDWPDRGVPMADMAILELMDRARPSKGPIVVHCSAGIGRTGSVVMLEYYMDQLLSGISLEDGCKVLLKIREQRNNSIQTEAQYLFVHMVLLNYFHKKKLLDDSAKDLLKSFSDEYAGAVV